MKIIQLKAENIKKISAIDISPDGNLVQITGKNAQGKSSVLDCIWYALGGAKDLPSLPIREGAESGEIVLDLGDYIVTRKFTQKTTTLAVKSKEGATYGSPQALLDKMLGDLAFDPLEFSRMKPKDQFERLRTISGVGEELDRIDGLIKTDFDARTEVNRKVTSLESQVAGIHVPAGTPDEPVNVSELVAEGERLRDENTGITAAQSSLVTYKQMLEAAKAEIAKQEEIIKASEELIAKAEAVAAKPLHDLTELRAKVASANDVNRAVADKQRRNQLKAQLAEATTEAEKLTAKVDANRSARLKIMEGAQMPVPGLTLEDGMIKLNGIPFTQASTAEQLKVSVAIAMAANPKIRVIRIKDGSLLDDDNMALIRGMADEKDYQIWIERVDGSGEVGVVMEEGHIKTVNA